MSEVNRVKEIGYNSLAPSLLKPTERTTQKIGRFFWGPLNITIGMLSGAVAVTYRSIKKSSAEGISFDQAVDNTMEEMLTEVEETKQKALEEQETL